MARLLLFMAIFHRQNRDAIWSLSISGHGPNYEIAPHFKLREVASRDAADKVYIHPLLLALLETIRAHFGAPVKINSAYRTQAHNEAVGGSSNSQHLYGMAADIVVQGVTPEEVAQYADTELKAGGVGRYQNFTHVDISGIDRRWSG